MKLKFRLICLILVLATVLPFAVACKDKGGNETNTGDAVTTTTEPSEENKEPVIDPNLLYFVLNGKTDYVIVRPTNMHENHKIVEACEALSEAIEAKTGVKIPVVTDSEPASDYEIIISETSRPESLELIRDIKNDQFALKAIGNKIVIYGYNDSITVGAVNYFADIAVHGINTNEKIMAVEKTFDASFLGKIENADITVMGLPLSQFTIVYPAKNYTASDKRLASYIVEQVYQTTGAFVRMGTDDSDYANEILVGKTLRTVADAPNGNVFSVSGKGGKLQFQSGSVFASYALLDYVIGELFAKNRPVLHIDENFEYSRDVTSTLKDGAQYANNVKGEYRMMVQNIWGNTGSNHTSRQMMTLELILAYNVDIISLQEVDPRNRQGGDYAIDKLLAAAGYSEVLPESVKGNNYTPIFYRTDKFEVVECDYQKYDTEYGDEFNDRQSKGYTWAVLKDKETGDTFAVLSTHFWYRHEGQADDAARRRSAARIVEISKQLTTKYGEIAIFATGDLNCGYTSGAVKDIINSGAVWAAYAAKSTENIRSHHSYPSYSSDLGTYINPVYPETGKVENSIDHILVFNNKSANLNRYDVCTDLYSLLTSDHCALFLDFDIK